MAATLLAGLRYGFLLAALAVIVSWSALWDKILSNGIGAHFGIYRGLLLILAGLLLVARRHRCAWRAGPAGRCLERAARDRHRGGGLGGARRIAELSGRVRPANPSRVRSRGPRRACCGRSSSWSSRCSRSATARRVGARGPAYVGGIGLAVFLVLAGSDVNDATPEGKIAGWPLVLVIVGVVAFAVSLVPGLKTPELDLEGRLRGTASRDDPAPDPAWPRLHPHGVKVGHAGGGMIRPVGKSSAELARQVLGALSNGDVQGFAALVHPDLEIRTARGVRRGKDDAEEWAQKRYEHLERRYAIDELRVDGDDVLALVRTQYVWRESGLVGDEEPTVIELEFKDGKLIRWAFREDLAADGVGRSDAGRA